MSDPMREAVDAAILHHAQVREAHLRSLLPLAGKIGCPKCNGMGAYIEVTRPFTASSNSAPEVVRMCDCTEPAPAPLSDTQP